MAQVSGMSLLDTSHASLPPDNDNISVAPSMAASDSTHQSQTHPAWTRPTDVYSCMTDALFDAPPESHIKGDHSAKTVKVKRPKIPPNVFYEQSRFFFDAPREPMAPQCSCNMMCEAKKPNLASFKCHSCVKFDPKSKGWFCNVCFNKCHPWYREKHHFVPIAEDDDMEYDLVAQNYRAELDRTISGVKTLIQNMKDSTAICRNIDEDYKPDDMMKENAKRIEKATQRVWELKHFVRGQLLAANTEESDKLVKDLEYNDEKRKLLTIIPYKTRGGLTPYAKTLHGEEARSKDRRARKEDKQMTDEEAAIVLQTGVRKMLARNTFLSKVSLNYQKVWNWKYMRYYYVNLRIGDGHSQWTRPPVVSRHTEDVVLTPRSFYEVHKTDNCADLEFLTSDVRAARERKNKLEKLQKKRAQKKEDRRMELLLSGMSEAADKSEAAIEKIKSEKAKKKGEIVDNDVESLQPSPTKEQREAADEAVLEAEELALVAVGAGAAAAGGLRRKKRRQIEEQKRAAKLRVLQLNVRAASLRAAEESLLRKGGMTREEASRKLQSACRIWLARRDLASRAQGLWLLVRPGQNKEQQKAGKRARAYYLNMRSNETKWIKPKAFGAQDVTEITALDYKKRKRKWFLRGNRFIVNMALTYPASKDSLLNFGALIIQKLGRMYLARAAMRDLTHETWIEQVDGDSGEMYWRNGHNGATKWEQPWTPRDTLARIRFEKKAAHKEAERQRDLRATGKF